MPQQQPSEPESIRELTLRLLKQYREKKAQRTFCDLVEEHERQRVALNLTEQDRCWLRSKRIDPR